MIPVPYGTAQAVQNNSTNYGLYFNKYVAIDDSRFEVRDNARTIWKDRYDACMKSVGGKQTRQHLNNRHLSQHGFCRMWEQKGWLTIILHAKLVSPMILGLGENHPGETGMLFDRNLGIPYIPASSIKGVVRLAHIVCLLKNEHGIWLDMNTLRDRFDLFEDKDRQVFLKENEKTRIPHLFGQTEEEPSTKGAVIFLDAYPIDIPPLKIDIMNPHYTDYYNGKRSPTEDQNPNPLKFLAVDEGVEFVFRAIVKPLEHYKDTQTELAAAYRQALVQEGIGAKTALGYGRFSILAEEEPSKIKEHLKQIELEKEKAGEQARLQEESARLELMSLDEKFLARIKQLKKDNQEIADLIRECLDQSDNREVFHALKNKLQELGEWKPVGSNKKKEKMRRRNEAIDKKLA
ncbi:MAG: type III-B CRISPR module RAMP protein Cmr6 [Desulfomonilia bacterium]